MTTVADILPQLEGVKATGKPGQYVACCPAHEDKHPSLSIATGAGGELLLHCHAGCSFEQILSRLDLRTNGNGHHPLPAAPAPSSNGSGKGSPRLIATYNYPDEQGKGNFRKLRYEPKDFRVQHANGRGGWQWGLGDAQVVLYNLPALVDPDGEWKPVYFTEGEKDADRLNELGLLATTNHEGALQKPLAEERVAVLRDRVVYCLADNDEPGRRHAGLAAASLHPLARCVKVVELPGLPAGGDVSDWLDAGHTREELEQICLMSPAWEPVALKADEVVKVDPGAVLSLRPAALAGLLAADMKPLEWMVKDLIARGQLVMIAGRPKSGKTWLVLQLAQAVDEGREFLGKETARGRVLLVTLEDGPRRLRSRVELLGWRPSACDVVFELAHLDGDGINVGPGLRQLDELAADYSLIVIDTLIAGLSGRADENSNTAMAMIANELAAIARSSNAAICLVHHTSKGTHEDVFHTIRGASSLRGAYDVGMVLERKKDEREGLLHVESKDIDGGSYTIRQGEGGAGWQLVGGAVELRKIRAGRQVVKTLLEYGDGVTAEDLAKTMGITRQAANQQLLAAEAQGLVKRKKPDVEQLQLVEGGPKKKADLWYLM